MRRSQSRIMWAVLALALLAPACRFEGLQFTNDHRLEWITEDRSVASLPLTLRWRLDGYEMVGRDGSSEDNAGYVAVFMDRSPQKPFEPLEVLAADDDACLPDRGCPDLEWFNDRGIFPVEEGNTLTIERIPLPRDEDRREFRHFTIVLLDGQGRRQGESAFRIELEIEREERGPATFTPSTAAPPTAAPSTGAPATGVPGAVPTAAPTGLPSAAPTAVPSPVPSPAVPAAATPATTTGEENQ